MSLINKDRLKLFSDCRKQKVRCLIIRDDGRVYEGINQCFSGETCAREEAGCKSGEGYELCGAIHAEIIAVSKSVDSNFPGTAYIYGHTYACMDCQHALTAANVRTIVLTGEPA